MTTEQALIDAQHELTYVKKMNKVLAQRVEHFKTDADECFAGWEDLHKFTTELFAEKGRILDEKLALFQANVKLRAQVTALRRRISRVVHYCQAEPVAIAYLEQILELTK